MGYGGLSLLDKLVICYKHCRYDVKYNLFYCWDENTSQPVADIGGSPGRGNALGRHRPSGGSEYVSSRLLISPFISLELGHLIKQTKRIYRRKWCFFRYVPRAGVWRIFRISCKRFPDAVDLIDRSVDQVRNDIYQLEKVYQNTIQCLSQKHSEKLNQRKKAQAQMYQDAIEDEQELFNAELIILYQKECELLIEKLRLIELMNVRIDQVKERYFFRIRYYYSKACEYSARYRTKGNQSRDNNGGERTGPLPFHHFTNEELSRMCGDVIGGDYTGALQKTKDELVCTKELLSRLSLEQEDGNEADSLSPEQEDGDKADSLSPEQEDGDRADSEAENV